MSNAPQTGAFFGVDVLARKPDAHVLVVDEIIRKDCVDMFPQFAVIGVKGEPKPDDALGDRTVLVWTVYPYQGLQTAYPRTISASINGGKLPAAFLSNPAQGFAYRAERTFKGM